MTGISVCEVKGFGRGRAVNAKHKIIDGLIAYIPMVKIEIMCADDIVDTIVAEIRKNAFTGLRGDGKIYVSEIIAAVRISTGESGNEAI